MADETTDFVARPYQVQLLEHCIKGNTIIYLPTGAGKTFIAIQTIKHFQADLAKPLHEGGRRTIFIANTVALVKQQYQVLKSATGFDVAIYTGDMNVDSWKKEKWRVEFESHQVIVATCQIIVDVIRHGYLSIKEINLLIFDECHNAVGGHPMHQLMSQFQDIPKILQPRVIGLTGVLLLKYVSPENVADTLEKLENTFMSIIRTVSSSDELVNVLIYSTKPKESVLQYEPLPMTPVMQKVKLLIGNYDAILDKWLMDKKVVSQNNYLNRKVSSPTKYLKNLLSDFLHQMDDFGLYGASIAILSLLIEVELKKKACETSNNRYVYSILTTGIDLILHTIEVEMRDIESTVQKVFQYGSPKLNRLLSYLENYNKNYGMDDMRCLIFVKRRYTAKCLYHILRKYSNPNLPVKPDFMIGVNNRIPESIESILECKWNRKVLEKFRKGETNVIIASSVLEEGIDVQSCNLVITYDFPENFKSYVQSKGRARSETSNFVMMLPIQDSGKYMENVQRFQNIQDRLKEILLNKAVGRKKPLETEINKELYSHELPPLVTKIGAKLEAFSAIPLINRYCNALPRDKFSTPTVIWTEHSEDENFYVTLQLPSISICRTVFKSPPKKSLDKAKRFVAFKACEELYKLGEFTENLLPITSIIKIEQKMDEFFKHWFKFQTDDPKKAGTKKNIRAYDLKYPAQLNKGLPCKNNDQYYIYEFRTKISPNSSSSCEYDIGKELFKELINQNETYGILTKNKLPELPEFKLYLSFGEINIKIIEHSMNCTFENINSIIRNLKRFHYTLFKNLLNIWKGYFMHDDSNSENSFLIVPLKNGCMDLDFVMNFQEISEPMKKTPKQRLNMQYERDDYLFNVISPTYRVDIDSRYIVIKVLDEQSPKTPFPNDEFSSFADYFMKKYDQVVVNNDQFLIEVKPMTTKLNRIHPMDETAKSHKRNMVEVLIPELCHNFKYPGKMWLKAILLPSILHRLHYMLHAENLRNSICEFLNINDLNYKPEPLDIDKKISDEEMYEDQFINNSIPIENNEHFNTKQTDITSLVNIFDCPWEDEEEPKDIDRNWDESLPVDLDYYYYFITNDFHNLTLDQKEESGIKKSKNIFLNAANPHLAICDVEMDEKRRNDILYRNEFKSPQLRDLLKAITTTSSADVFDLERFELLGDSFLKFTASLYLFQKYPSWHEGYLTSFRAKIISNRNLLYCGIIHRLPEIMKVNKFQPSNDWVPPLLGIPMKLIEELNYRDISANYLYRINFSEDELMSGEIDRKKIDEFLMNIETDRNDNIDTSSLNNFLMKQFVSDKSVSDCVEAIIGVCVNTMGIENSLGIFQYFNILPNGYDLRLLINSKDIPNPLIKDNVRPSEIDDLLVNYRKIEQILGYQFKNRAFLLQALTHASFISNYLTNCYQQLEFLGDAILDFLVTTYIFESGKTLTPGLLTDLRSAIVNNGTLAAMIVKHNIHVFMLYDSPGLSEAIKKFSDFQRKHNYDVTDEVQLLVHENDVNIAEYIDVPKSLGDIFESLVGAVFLDSNKSLLTTWNVIYNLIGDYINQIINNVPKQLVRQLYEFPNANPKFADPEILDDGTIMIEVSYIKSDQINKALGFGQNSEDAKKAAAKMALNNLIRK